MSERTPSLLPKQGVYKRPQEFNPQNPQNIAENSISAEKIGRKTFGVVLVGAGLFMVVWGANKAIEGATGSGLGDFIIGAAIAYAGWKITTYGFKLIKN